MEPAQEEFSRSRLIPLGSLVLILVLLGLHHWHVMAEQSGYLIAMFLLPPLGMLALGGLLYPPIFYSIGQHGSELPMWTRATGVLLVLSGLGIGFCLYRFYGF